MTALLLLAVALTAQPHPVMLLGEGQFSGQLGTYASGDTLYCVYSSSVNPAMPGDIILKKSHDGGLNWNSEVVANAVMGLGSPTVSKAGAEIIVSYVSGYERFMARSWDEGQTWQISSTGRSFESSPYTEKVDGEYRTFSLELPYPQEDQDRYLISPSSQSMKMPQYLTDIEEYPDSETATFNGYDVLQGGVRTNSDLWIRQMGGGENNGWPTFWGPVICGGVVRVYPDGGNNYPAAEIFRGGLIENAPWLDVPFPNRRDAMVIGPSYYDPNKIVLIEVDGNTYHGKMGTITPPVEQSANVYDIYPASPLGEPLYTNQYTEADTIWTLLAPGNCSNKMFFTHCPLWIKGNFSGHQSWQSGDNLFIIGDITLSGTPPGQDPADNLNDSVSLLSERNVMIKYGYRDPADSLRYHLVRGDDDPIYIYADISAAGVSTNYGMFTFEYQQPHPSVPAVNHLGQYWDQIDLHRRPYPQTDAQPWPAIIDYPWYNPLWPEAKPYLERGKLQIWGSIMQRRRGLLHKALNDSNNPTGIWNPAQNLYGGSSSPAVTNHIDPVLGIELGTQNYPGATGNGIGYKKDHRYDSRGIFGVTEQDIWSVNESMWWNLGILASHLNAGPDNSYIEDTFESNRTQQLRRFRCKAFARRGNRAVYAFNDKLLYLRPDFYDIDYPNQQLGDILGMQWLDDNLLLQHKFRFDASSNQRKLVVLNMTTRLDQLLDIPGGTAPFPEDSVFSDILVTPDGTAYFGRFDPEFNTLRLWSLGADQLFTLTGQWNINLNEVDGPGPGSKLVLRAGTDAQVDAFICWQRAYDIPESYDWDRVYHCRIDPATSENSDPVPPALLPSISVYPNPARAHLTLDIKGVPDQQINAEIYNIRGQKVASLDSFEHKDDGSLTRIWDGCDASGKRLPSGVYLIRFKAGKTLFVKRVSIY